MRTVYYLYFVDEEADGQRSEGTPSNSHGSEMVELGYHRSKNSGSDWNYGEDCGMLIFFLTMKF